MLTWYAIETNPQCEVRACRGLKEQGFTAYLPVETNWKRSRAKQRERVDKPLFTGYLFVGITPEQQLWPVRHVDGVRGIVSLNGEPYEIGLFYLPEKPNEPVHFVYWLQSRQAMGEFDHTPARKSVYRKGDRARVLNGQFKGHVGEMLEADDRGRVKIMLEGIFGGKMWIDDDHLEAA